MATALLQSHDCLRDHFGPRIMHSANPNPRFNYNHSSRCRRRKRSPADRNRRSNHSTSPPSKALVMGQVKILKRGEDLNPRFFRNTTTDIDLHLPALDLCSTHRLGPDPETVQKQIRVPDLYAGVTAPPPSSLPIPTSLVRRSVAESDLRKLLRI